jgi:hypothetical protein
VAFGLNFKDYLGFLKMCLKILGESREV